MRVSCLVCVTNPEERQDIWQESIASMIPWADEIVIVNGGKPILHKLNANWRKKIKMVDLPWPHEFSWDELPKHLNAGLKECTGNYVVRADIDYVFKDCWKASLWELKLYGGKRIITAQKFSTTLVNKVYQKGPTPMIINMAYGDMCFGVAEGKYTDLCVPIIQTGMRGDIPEGKMIEDRDIYRSHLEFMNYDYCFKTKEFTAKEFLRFSRAHKRYFGSTKWGSTEEESLQKFINMMNYRINQKGGHIFDTPWQLHPTFIKEKVRDIKPEHFGHSGWGKFK